MYAAYIFPFTPTVCIYHSFKADRVKITNLKNNDLSEESQSMRNGRKSYKFSVS